MTQPVENNPNELNLWSFMEIFNKNMEIESGFHQIQFYQAVKSMQEFLIKKQNNDLIINPNFILYNRLSEPKDKILDNHFFPFRETSYQLQETHKYILSEILSQHDKIIRSQLTQSQKELKSKQYQFIIDPILEKIEQIKDLDLISKKCFFSDEFEKKIQLPPINREPTPNRLKQNQSFYNLSRISELHLQKSCKSDKNICFPNIDPKIISINMLQIKIPERKPVKEEKEITLQEKIDEIKKKEDQNKIKQQKEEENKQRIIELYQEKYQNLELHRRHLKEERQKQQQKDIDKQKEMKHQQRLKDEKLKQLQLQEKAEKEKNDRELLQKAQEGKNLKQQLLEQEKLQHLMQERQKQLQKNIEQQKEMKNQQRLKDEKLKQQLLLQEIAEKEKNDRELQQKAKEEQNLKQQQLLLEQENAKRENDQREQDRIKQQQELIKKNQQMEQEQIKDQKQKEELKKILQNEQYQQQQQNLKQSIKSQENKSSLEDADAKNKIIQQQQQKEDQTQQQKQQVLQQGNRQQDLVSLNIEDVVDESELEDIDIELNRNHKINFRMIRLENYNHEEGMSFDLYIMNEKGIIKDAKNNQCQIESQRTYGSNNKNKVCQFNLDHVFSINLHDLKSKFPLTYKNIYVVVIFDIEDIDNLEDDYGWFAHPLFTKEGHFNIGEFSKYVWQLPIQYKIPYDLSSIKILQEKTKLVYECDEAIL